MNRLLYGIFLMLVAQILTFYQIQGPLKFESFKNNYWLVILMGIPLSMLYVESIKQIVTHYNGLVWPGRLIGFGVGVIVFAFLSYYIFNENFTTKTIICLVLSFFIILIQIFWK
jgi:multidrug transporter EmrE-like cation transporter